MTDDIVIVAAARTPIEAPFQFQISRCAPKSQSVSGAVVIKEVLKRANIAPKDVSEVIMGQVLTAGQGQNPARQAAIKAGLAETTPAHSINFLCGSGLHSVADGYFHIAEDFAEIVVCGGQESMSQGQHAAYLRPGVKLGEFRLLDTVLHDGLTDAFFNCLMGVTAEHVAEKYNVSRAEQDKLAYESQRRTDKAIKAGRFEKEIVPVAVQKKNEVVLVTADEFPKPDCTLSSLQKLKPGFIENGTVTVGNATGINDGAAAVVLMKKSEADRRCLPSLAKIVAVSKVGVAPMVMGLAPIQAIQAIFKKTGWSKDDVDAYEINEAYASMSVVIMKELDLNPDKVNIFGGAMALGHPLGSSGTRVLVTLLSVLEQTGGKKGVAALCVGGGQGIAMAVEKL